LIELKLDNKTTCLVHIGLSYSSDVIVMLISTLFMFCPRKVNMSQRLFEHEVNDFRRLHFKDFIF